MKGTHRRFVGLAILSVALMIVAAFAAPSGAPVAAHGDEPHPAHIHAGTCDAVGEVVFPLTDVAKEDDHGTPEAMDGTPMADDHEEGEDDAEHDMDASPEADDEEEGELAGMSSTTVQADLATILGAPHVINVHESAEAIQNYVACGAITGTPEDGELTIELAELNESGYDGEATLTDNGDGTTTVEIELYAYHDDEEEGGAEGEVAATIENFAFSPEPIEIKVGTTVTWTNLDSAPHTVSQTGGGFESGKMDQGATFSFTFTEAGTFEYFCQFHPNMKGTVIVTA